MGLHACVILVSSLTNEIYQSLMVLARKGTLLVAASAGIHTISQKTRVVPAPAVQWQSRLACVRSVSAQRLTAVSVSKKGHLSLDLPGADDVTPGHLSSRQERHRRHQTLAWAYLVPWCNPRFQKP